VVFLIYRFGGGACAWKTKSYTVGATHHFSFIYLRYKHFFWYFCQFRGFRGFRYKELGRKTVEDDDCIESVLDEVCSTHTKLRTIGFEEER
jgi:hypothetical protein